MAQLVVELLQFYSSPQRLFSAPPGSTTTFAPHIAALPRVLYSLEQWHGTISFKHKREGLHMAVHAGRLDAEVLSVTRRVGELLQKLPRDINPVNLEELRRIKQALVELENKVCANLISTCTGFVWGFS